MPFFPFRRNSNTPGHVIFTFEQRRELIDSSGGIAAKKLSTTAFCPPPPSGCGRGTMRLAGWQGSLFQVIGRARAGDEFFGKWHQFRRTSPDHPRPNASIRHSAAISVRHLDGESGADRVRIEEEWQWFGTLPRRPSHLD